MPDDLVAATREFRTQASGIALSVRMFLLIPQQIDEALHRDASYRTPGH
ncbi:hypothetical protein [Rhodococcus aetherivorans]